MDNVDYIVVNSDVLAESEWFNNLIAKQWLEVDERRKSSDLNVQWDSYINASNLGMQFWVLALRGESVLGYVSMLLTPSMHTGELTALTDTMYVIPEERGSGVGSGLINKVEEVVRERGAKHLMVTFKNDVNHAPIVERLGLFNYETVYCKPLA